MFLQGQPSSQSSRPPLANSRRGEERSRRGRIGRRYDTIAEITRATVFRYNPSADPKPYYETYNVPWRNLMSVLELVRYIHEEIRPVSFDYCCRAACCGTCSLQVDGKPVLACVTAVLPGDVLIEPLRSFRVIKDLIVDRTEIENRLYGTRPWFSRAKPMTEPLAMPPEAYVRTAVLQLCKDCLCCQSICPVLKTKGFSVFAGPSILTKIAMRYFDTREDFADERLKIAVLEGLFECTLCGLCDDVCPMGKLIETPGYPQANINHVKTFKMMMEKARDKGWGP
jgi:succinate dehydrogenase/fumarate reductase iron-sulfur protein